MKEDLNQAANEHATRERKDDAREHVPRIEPAGPKHETLDAARQERTDQVLDKVQLPK